MKILYNNTKEAREKVKTRPESLKYVNYKFTPIELESPTATLIYANKVVLQSWTKEPFAVIIESEEMAENQRRYFEELSAIRHCGDGATWGKITTDRTRVQEN